jgi:hypothetical protein
MFFVLLAGQNHWQVRNNKVDSHWSPAIHNQTAWSRPAQKITPQQGNLWTEFPTFYFIGWIDEKNRLERRTEVPWQSP